MPLPVLAIIALAIIIHAYWSEWGFGYLIWGSSSRRSLVPALLFILGLILFVALAVVFLLLPSPRRG